MPLTAEKNSDKPKLFIKTFGCQMNEYDSEKISALMQDQYSLTSNAEEADFIFVNTCSVREKGEHKMRSIIGEYNLIKKKRPQTIIGVGGCVAQQEGTQLIKAIPEVDFVVGTHNLSLVPSLVTGALAGKSKQVVVDYRDEWEDLPLGFRELTETGEQVTPIRALVSIQRGCNKNCSYCVVPNTRGPEVSRDPQEIIREISLKVRMGAKEVMLLGQTVNSYGRDLNPRLSFVDLIKRIAEIPDLKRIRFTSPHPQEVKSDFINLYAEVPQLVPHIHMPLQAGSDRILKLMNRNYRSKRYFEIIDELRAKVPTIAITTDMIVGYPSETEADFQDTLEALQRVRYHLVYSFCYSLRPHTADSAQENLELVAEDVARDRLYRLQDLQDNISRELHQQYLGQNLAVLIESLKGENPRGRSEYNTWVECLPQSTIQRERIKLGQIIQVKIEHATPYGLRGQII
ncbi:tRNA (N6-isopentenyl adenosine(37)-C2)-methylthiotransferase MiaB [bacterium]|nr:tRNA (N6-isopentenyl adenosine(37)-C2)-methylthiotransferase MiaB [bacterium]